MVRWLLRTLGLAVLVAATLSAVISAIALCSDSLTPSSDKPPPIVGLISLHAIAALLGLGLRRLGTSDRSNRASTTPLHLRDADYLQRRQEFAASLERGDVPSLPAHGHPFNLVAGEQLIWLFPYVEYHRTETGSEYVGGNSGFSIRVAKGLTWRVGSFKGKRVQRREVKFVDTGIVGVTTRHIYFSGDFSKFRVPLEDFIEFSAVDENGICAQRDSDPDEAEYFMNGDSEHMLLVVRWATHLARSVA